MTSNVFDAALARIRYLFDEFEEVVVTISGGKDSTVVLNLALMVAREKGRLPLSVFFLDQEAEWQTVIDHMREVMNSPEVNPLWMQCPIRIFNATSESDPWLRCWEPGEKWIREQEPNSLKQNIYGCDRFHGFFEAFMKVHARQLKACMLSGVRAEESPTRYAGLTSHQTYKWITWGKKLHKGSLGEHYTFYPLYDWSYTDVWKAIQDNAWPYCKIYDYMYQQGVPINKMRVSNVHHETSVHTLFYLQEIEGETWNRITEMVAGINTAGKLGARDYFVRELPYMFASWKEYRDYLVDNLIQVPANQATFKKAFARLDEQFEGTGAADRVYLAQIQSVLTNDIEMTKMKQFLNRERAHGALAAKRSPEVANA